MTGCRFNRLVVLKEWGRKYRRREITWLCKCDCGNLKEVTGNHLRMGNVKSCGCYKHIFGWKHGGTHTRLYNIWLDMKTRCYNLTSSNYRRYGGRGIRVCPEWNKDFPVFRTWAMANGYQGHLTIDKIDNNGNYEPGNCQWLTRSENVKKGVK